jgi:hypothetical protein
VIFCFLINNTIIDVLDDRDNHSFGKMTNVRLCDQDRSVLKMRVWVCMEEVLMVAMVVWMVQVYSNHKSLQVTKSDLLIEVTYSHYGCF